MDADEAYAAARCRHYHRNGRSTPEEKAAHEGRADLIARTWKADPPRDLNRDERRLMGRYKRTLDAATAADVEAYHRCTKCQASRIAQTRTTA